MFVVFLLRISVVRMLQCLFLTFSSLKLLLFCFMYTVIVERMLKKQQTLAAFGFTKTVLYRESEIKVDLPTEVTLSSANLKCLKCEKKFINQQGLSVHIKCKHPMIDNNAVDDNTPNNKTKLNENENSYKENIVLDENENEMACDTDLPHAVLQTKDERRRGRDKRRSITNELKSKIIAEVESGEKAIEVSEKYNVNRCQISAWLKKKDVITKAAVNELKSMFKVRPAKKYNGLFR